MSDDANGTTTDDNDGTGAAGDDSGAGTTTDDTGAATGSADQTYTKAEYDAIHARMQAADRTATRLQQEKQAAEDAKKDEVTRVKDQNTRLVEEVAALKEENKKLLLKGDFGLSGVQWHNPAIALTTMLAEYPDAVTVGDDGKVIGMKAAVDKLAKEHAYLVRATEEKKDEDTGTSAATGSVKNGKRKGDQNQEALQEALRKRMPALAARSNKR